MFSLFSACWVCQRDLEVTFTTSGRPNTATTDTVTLSTWQSYASQCPFQNDSPVVNGVRQRGLIGTFPEAVSNTIDLAGIQIPPWAFIPVSGNSTWYVSLFSLPFRFVILYRPLSSQIPINTNILSSISLLLPCHLLIRTPLISGSATPYHPIWRASITGLSNRNHTCLRAISRNGLQYHTSIHRSINTLPVPRDRQFFSTVQQSTGSAVQMTSIYPIFAARQCNLH